MSTAVFAIARDRMQAESLVSQLRAAGFSNQDISVLLSDPNQTRDFAHEKATKAPEGATAGGITGGVLGGILGWLAGAGALVIPGVGPLIAAGPIMAALGGAAVGGAVGGVAGTLVGMGIPEYEAKLYEGKIKEGRALISVHTEDSDEKDRAKEIFERAGAEHISSTSEKNVDKKTRDRH
jgi:hypothetical protein